MADNKTNWGEASLYKITSPSGEYAVVSDYGATLVSVFTYDKEGKLGDIVLGYDNLKEYKVNPKNVGASIGRYANRIAFGTFTLDGKEFHVTCNRPPHSIHGGEEGFDKKMWKVSVQREDHLELEYISPNGEEGFPGRLATKAIFDFAKAGELVITYEAETDAPTVCSLTNHSYWNLNGASSGIEGLKAHKISVASDFRTEQDEDGIPTGKLIPLADTSFDLNTEKHIGDLITDPMLIPTRGIDHTYALKESEISATAYGEISGRVMKLSTNLPAMQVYLGGNLPEGLKGKDGVVYGKHSAFCMETQHFPDAMNHEEFPSPVLLPGEKKSFITKLSFETK